MGRNVLGFLGLSPVKETLIGMADDLGESVIHQWRDKLEEMGAMGL
jgi:hypothetical protein